MNFLLYVLHKNVSLLRLCTTLFFFDYNYLCCIGIYVQLFYTNGPLILMIHIHLLTAYHILFIHMMPIALVWPLLDILRWIAFVFVNFSPRYPFELPLIGHVKGHNRRLLRRTLSCRFWPFGLIPHPVKPNLLGAHVVTHHNLFHL